MENYFGNALARYAQMMQVAEGLKRQRAQDAFDREQFAVSERRNALAEQYQRMQMDEMQRQQQQQQATQGAMGEVYGNLDYLGTGDFNQRSGELVTEAARTRPGANLAGMMQAIQGFQLAQPEFQIVDGQYVPKQPGGQAVPIPGFKPTEKPQTEQWVDWGYGKKRNVVTGEIADVPTAPKDESKREPPSGYRWSDTGGLEPIKGGPADKGATGPTKPVPAVVEGKLTKTGAFADSAARFLSSFQDNYGGNVIAGDWENAARRIQPGGDPTGQAQWWQDYQSYVNQVRNDIFGAALTPQEKSEFLKQIITPRMSPEEIRKNLNRQKQLAETALDRLSSGYSRAYDNEQIEAFTGRPLKGKKAPTATGQSSVADMSDEELLEALGR